MPEEEATIIYHYTSEEGMRGIVESDRIWATDIGFLNDYTEFRQAFKEEYVGALTDAFREGLPKDLYDTARVVIEGILSKRISNILKIIQDSISTHQAFVCSFTTLPRPSGADPGDRLSQWRGYSRSSQGLSLGFNKTLLTKQIEFDNGYSKAVLLECIYEDKETFFFFRQWGARPLCDLRTAGFGTNLCQTGFKRLFRIPLRNTKRPKFTLRNPYQRQRQNFLPKPRGSNIAGSVKNVNGG